MNVKDILAIIEEMPVIGGLIKGLKARLSPDEEDSIESYSKQKKATYQQQLSLSNQGALQIANEYAKIEEKLGDVKVATEDDAEEDFWDM